MKGRTPTTVEQRFMSKVAELGCIVCRNKYKVFSPAAIHHIEGKTKIDAHFIILPLCPKHHQTGGYGIALHAGRAEWEKRYGTQAELHLQVLELIANGE